MKASLTCLGCLIAAAFLLAAEGDARLIEVAKRGDTAAARQLLDEGVSGHAAEADGTTALHWAVQANAEDLVRELLRAGARAGEANRYGVTPLALAAQNGSTAVVRMLLDAGANPNAAQGEGQTVLMMAARSGLVAPIELLLSKGADPNAHERGYGETALMWAAGHNHPDAVKALIKGGADPNARSTTITLPAARPDLATMVTTALPRGGMTALMFAARQGAKEAALALLDSGADPDIGDPDGTSALVFAIINMHYDVAAALAERGADPDVADSAGMGALYAAIDMVQPPLLLNRPPARPSGTLTAAALVEILLRHGADPNLPLEAPLLMRQHSPGDGALGNGATPLMRAARLGDVSLVRSLLAAGASPSLAMANGTTTMMAALGGRGARTITPDTPMFQVVQAMLDSGAAVNAAAPSGETLLHQAVARGEAFVTLLLQHGADPRVKDSSGRTPLDVAMGVAPAPGRAGGGGRGGGRGGPPAPPARADDATIASLRAAMQQ